METRVVVPLSSIAFGANFYVVSRRFEVLERPAVAGSLVLTTGLAALTTPLALTLIGV